MAVQAFAIVIRNVQFDILRLRGSAEILDENVAKPPELGAETTVESRRLRGLRRSL